MQETIFILYLKNKEGEKEMLFLANIKIDMTKMIPYLGWFWDGTKLTIAVSLVTVILGCFIGFLATLAKRSKYKVLNGIANVYTQVIRGTPMLLQLYIWTLGLPSIGLKIPDLFGSRSSLLITTVIALAFNSGAYICEIFRAGLNSVDKGQEEAARSLGLNSKQTMRFVILPQAIKTILPSLGNEFIMMIKESSMVSTIGVADVMYQQKIIQGATYRVIEPLVVIGIIYLILTTILTTGIGILERKLNKDAKN